MECVEEKSKVSTGFWTKQANRVHRFVRDEEFILDMLV